MHRWQSRHRRRLAAGVLAGTMVLAACGGSGDDSASEALPEAAGVDASGGDPTIDAAGDAPVALAEGAAMVDLVGTDVLPASEIASNLLPDIVIDDLSNDRKVNFRNLVPQEKPILLWMYAPH